MRDINKYFRIENTNEAIYFYRKPPNAKYKELLIYIYFPGDGSYTEKTFLTIEEKEMINDYLKRYRIKYFIYLKDTFSMPNTTINKAFCGYINKILKDTIIFELNGSHALTIIPVEEIEWMAPIKDYIKGYFNDER